MAKLNSYYERSAESDAHIMAMVLEPSTKMSYFNKNWSPDLVSKVENAVQVRFLERFNALHQDHDPGTKPTHIRKGGKVHKSARRNLDDTDSEDDADDLEATVASPNAWMDEWRSYLNTNEDIPEGMSIVRWWGVNGSRYPTWRSLARDYLAIMASSVSSERAFSSAGITICKRRNRLDGDIVEALQCLKALLHQDISLAVIPTVADEETSMDDADLQYVNQEGPAREIVEGAEDWTWDQVMQEQSDDDGNDDIIELDA